MAAVKNRTRTARTLTPASAVNRPRLPQHGSPAYIADAVADELQARLHDPVQRSREATVHMNGVIVRGATVPYIVGTTVRTEQNDRATFLGGTSRHAVLRMEDGTIDAWEWGSVYPDIDEFRAGEEADKLDGSLEDLNTLCTAMASAQLVKYAHDDDAEVEAAAFREALAFRITSLCADLWPPTEAADAADGVTGQPVLLANPATVELATRLYTRWWPDAMPAGGKAAAMAAIVAAAIKAFAEQPEAEAREAVAAELRAQSKARVGK